MAALAAQLATDAARVSADPRFNDLVPVFSRVIPQTWAALKRAGIGRALLSRMLRDDRALGSVCSVLTASHTGALLYPRVGYERIGMLFMFVPRQEARLRTTRAL